MVIKFEVYCIVGVVDSFKIDVEFSEYFGCGVFYVEYFVNGLDFFCWIGVLVYLEYIVGEVFILLECKGYLFNDYYIFGIWCGEYCNCKLCFFKYIDGYILMLLDFVFYNYE